MGSTTVGLRLNLRRRVAGLRAVVARVDRAVLALVLVVAAVAAAAHAAYRDNLRSRWTSPSHDRNAH